MIYIVGFCEMKHNPKGRICNTINRRDSRIIRLYRNSYVVDIANFLDKKESNPITVCDLARIFTPESFL